MDMKKLFITVVLMQGVMFASEAKKGTHNQSLTQQATLSNSHHNVASGDSLHSTVVSVLNHPHAGVLHHGVGAITFGASDLTVAGHGVHTLGSTGLGITPKIGVPATVNGQAPIGLYTPTETASTYTTPHMSFNGTVSGAGTTAPVLTISEDTIVSGDMKLRNMSLVVTGSKTLTVKGTLVIDGASGGLADNVSLSVAAGSKIVADNIKIINLNSTSSGAAVVNILGDIVAIFNILIDGNTSADGVVVNIGAAGVVEAPNVTISNNVTSDGSSNGVDLLSGGSVSARDLLSFVNNEGGSGLGVLVADGDTGIFAGRLHVEVGASDQEYDTTANHPQDYFLGSGNNLAAANIREKDGGSGIDIGS